MIVDCAHYRDGARQQAAPMSIADAAASARRDDGGFVWLGLHDPTESEMSAIQENFPVHELAIEDAREEHQRAKIEDYDNDFFVVLRTSSYDLKREVIEFFRAVHPLLAPLAVIERGADPRVTDDMRRYFRDVNDHVELVHDEIASHRDLLTSILEANLAVLGKRQNEISVSQNETTKQLTLVATIFLPLTFVTGFFGQNFGWLVRHISSELVFLVYGVGSLALSCVLLLLWFRRSRYL